MKTEFGWAILRVQKIIPKIVIPFVAVKDSIAHDMAVERAKSQLGRNS